MRGAVHEVTVKTPTVSAVDGEGVPAQKWTTVVVRGRAEELSAADEDRQTALGERQDITVQVSHQVTVETDCQVVVRGVANNPWLDGEYLVTAVSRAYREPTRLTCLRLS